MACRYPESDNASSSDESNTSDIENDGPPDVENDLPSSSSASRNTPLDNDDMLTLDCSTSMPGHQGIVMKSLKGFSLTGKLTPSSSSRELQDHSKVSQKHIIV